MFDDFREDATSRQGDRNTHPGFISSLVGGERPRCDAILAGLAALPLE
jgi:hypothetical protein